MNTNTTTPTYSSNLDDLEPVDASTSATHGAAAGVGPARPCAIAPVFDTAAAESLRTFAVSHGEMAFTHLVTAALNGEAFAVERISGMHARINGVVPATAEGDAFMLHMIRTTDTSRPDGATARSFVMP